MLIRRAIVLGVATAALAATLSATTTATAAPPERTAPAAAAADARPGSTILNTRCGRFGTSRAAKVCFRIWGVPVGWPRPRCTVRGIHVWINDATREATVKRVRLVAPNGTKRWGRRRTRYLWSGASTLVAERQSTYYHPRGTGVTLPCGGRLRLRWTGTAHDGTANRGLNLRVRHR